MSPRAGDLPDRTRENAPSRGPVLLWRRLGFGVNRRVEVWQLLADVLEGSGADLGRMMEAVAEGYALQGRGTVAAVLHEIRAGLTGGDIASRLAPYCGASERILFEGLGKRSAGAVFRSAARLLRSQAAMRKAILGAIAMPVLMLGGLVGLVMFFGLSLLPALEEIVDLSALPGIQGWIARTTRAFAANPLAVAMWAGVLAAALWALLRFWTGPGRTWADRFPPFSLMRLQTGAGFLFAVVEYGRGDQQVKTELLERMASVAGPYGRSRIGALARCYARAGGNLGDAALMAGQGFPALELSAVLRTLWNRPGGIDRCGDVLERWLGRMEDSVRARMAVANAVLLALMAATLLALMSIALPIVEQINQGVPA